MKDDIVKTINNYSLKSENPEKAKIYLGYMTSYLRLCCQYKGDTVLAIIEEIAKQP